MAGCIWLTKTQRHACRGSKSTADDRLGLTRSQLTVSLQRKSLDYVLYRWNVACSFTGVIPFPNLGSSSSVLQRPDYE